MSVNSEEKKPQDVPKPPSIKGYTDPVSGFSNTELRTAEWYVRHRIGIKKLLIGMLIAVNVVLVGFSLYGWGKFLFVDFMETRQILADLSASRSYRAQSLRRFQPQELQVKSVQVFHNGVNKYDFVAGIENPNEHWMAYVEYTFKFRSSESDSSEVLVLPGTEQVAGTFGVDASGFPTGVQIDIKNVRWKRVDPHAVEDTQVHIGERIDFSADNVTFIPASTVDGAAVHSILFDITNNTVYGYWLPGFTVFYLSNGSPVGVKYIQVDRFEALESREIDLKTFAQNIRVDGIRLVPDIHIFDQDTFMEPGL